MKKNLIKLFAGLSLLSAGCSWNTGPIDPIPLMIPAATMAPRTDPTSMAPTPDSKESGP